MTLALAAAAIVAGLAAGALVILVVERVVDGRSRTATAIGIEAMTIGIFLLFAAEFGASAELPAFLVLGATLVAQTWVDLYTNRLPREITNAGLMLGAVALIVAAIVLDEPHRIWMMALGAVVATAALALIYVVSRGSFGAGDVRLAPLLGMYLGWLDPWLVLPGLFFGFVAGAVVGGAMVLGGFAHRRTTLPFGPFLALGTVLAILFGSEFLDLILAR